MKLLFLNKYGKAGMKEKVRNSEFKYVIIHIHCQMMNRLTLILLIMTIVVLFLFYYSTKSLLLGMKCVSRHQDLQIFVLKSNKYK